MNIPRHFTQGVEDKPDFELIYRQYYKRIYNYVYGQFLHRETAEDVTDGGIDSPAEIKAPTLIIAGSKDPYVSPALCEEAYKTLSNKESRLVIIEGAGHAMLMERPYYRRFREKVRDFLNESAR